MQVRGHGQGFLTVCKNPVQALSKGIGECQGFYLARDFTILVSLKKKEEEEEEDKNKNASKTLQE